MSAYIVGKDLIDLLVTVGMENAEDRGGLRVFHDGSWRLFSRYEGGADQLGQILTDENYRSVNYRYSEEDTPTRYTYKSVGYQYVGGSIIPWGQIFAALDCYEYQACETPDWEQSLAYAICRRIRRIVCRRIADACDAEWEWTREDMAQRMADKRSELARG